jgi:hypothetical protein
MFRIVAAAVAAALPQAGVLVPGKSLGGIRLGEMPKQVLATWGRSYGRCAGCRHPTWYFTYGAFQPQGAGVEFRHGRVAAAFTLWQPQGWHTPRQLTLGDPAERITEIYGPLPRADCLGYHALTRPSRGALTTFYVSEEKLWGFGLMRPHVLLCR